MNTQPVTSPASKPIWFSLSRSVATIGLLLAVTLIAFLLVAGGMPVVFGALEQVSSAEGKVPGAAKAALGVTCLVVVLLPSIFTFVASRRKWITGRFLLIGWATVLPVLGWLSWDEPSIRHPLPVEEFSPAFAGAEKSYAVLMQYSKRTPSEEAQAFDGATLRPPFGGASPREPAKWLEFVTKHREALGSDWETLAPQRRWLGELNAFDRIGDLTPTDPAADIPTFKVWRALSQRTCAKATLLALDGRRDEAIEVLVPMLEAGRKLQPSARTLVRAMIGLVVERMCIETASIVLDQGQVSAAASARLTAALGPDNAAAMARRLILIEYVQSTPVFLQMRLGDQLAMAKGWARPLVRAPLNFLSGLFINPNATTNLYGEHVFALAKLAEARELGKFAVHRQGFDSTLLKKPGIKNLAGRLMLNMAVPSYEKVLDSHWKVADLRAAVGARLNGRSAAAAP